MFHLKLLSQDVIQQICDSANLVFSVDDVIDKCHVSQYSTACAIVAVFSKVLEIWISTL